MAALLARTSTETAAEPVQAVITNTPTEPVPVAPLGEALGDDEHGPLNADELEAIGAVPTPKKGRK